MLTRKHSPKGIVSIVALGIFALLVVFGIIVANIVNQSYTNVKNTNEYLTAKALGDSALEFLEQKLQDFGPGYNSGEITCVFNGADEEVAGGPNEDGAQNEYCDEFAAMVGDEPVTITMEIKGRAEEGEDLNSNECARLRNCYTVPLPSAGNAGKNCELYKPAYGPNDSPTVPREVAGFNGVDQVDFACNWNKLSLGSDASRGVTIPLYAQITEDLQSHPFNGDLNAKFILRLRTPCNCQPNDQNCNHNACSIGDRYQLERSNEVLVDWQISGLCGDEQKECGLVSSPEVPDSQITSALIIDSSILIDSSEDEGWDNTVNLGIPRIINGQLSDMVEPKLKILLSKPLVGEEETTIPYLEYQILSSQPVSQNNIHLSASVKVNSVLVKVEKNQEIKSEIIDFAIQN